MTCIAGVVHGKRVYLAGDSCGSTGAHRSRMGDAKVFVRGNMAFGYSGSFRLGQLLEHAFTIPEQLRSHSDMKYLCGPFVDSLRHCFREAGIMDRRNEGTETMEGRSDFLLGYGGKLYLVANDYSVLEQHDSIAATGSGYAYALGALAVLGGSPKKRLAAALAAAAHLDPNVMGPFNLVCV